MSNEPARGDLTSSTVTSPALYKKQEHRRLLRGFDANLYPGQGFILFLVSVAAIFLLVLIFVDVRPLVGTQKTPEATFVDYQLSEPGTVEQNVSQYRALSAEEKRIIVSDFEKNWGEASDEYSKYGAYRTLYTSLHARYNVTKDPQILDQLSKIEEFVSSVEAWKEYYDATKADGGFI